MGNERILQLVLNRLIAEQKIEPKYIGEFHGVGALPKCDYPPIYCWIDREISGAWRLSFNTPLLSEMCFDEARKAGMSIDDVDVSIAIEFIRDLVTPSFQAALAKL